MPGSIESFYIWWDEHEAKGELNGVDKPDAQMVWMEAHRTLDAENERLRGFLKHLKGEAQDRDDLKLMDEIDGVLAIR